MDKNIIFVYFYVMELYYDPRIRLLYIKKCSLRKWHYDHPKLPFWRLYWGSGSAATIRCLGEIVALTSKRIVLVPPNTELSQRMAQGPVTHFGVHFLADAPFNRLHSKLYVFKAEGNMPDAIKAMPLDDEDCLTNNPILITAVRGLIHVLLSKIPAEDMPPVQIQEHLAKSMTFIEENLQRSLSYLELARQMNMSVSTMLRLYQRELGLSPHEYLCQKRIEKACLLIHDRRTSIEQIAEETGFCDRYHFTKVFSRTTGQSPARFRAYGRKRI